MSMAQRFIASPFILVDWEGGGVPLVCTSACCRWFRTVLPISLSCEGKCLYFMMESEGIGFIAVSLGLKRVKTTSQLNWRSISGDLPLLEISLRVCSQKNFTYRYTIFCFPFTVILAASSSSISSMVYLSSSRMWRQKRLNKSQDLDFKRYDF